MNSEKNLLPSDQELMKYYKMGWKECFDGNKKTFENKWLQRAYDIGWIDCIAGDDVPSIDLQTNEEILNSIKNINL